MRHRTAATAPIVGASKPHHIAGAIAVADIRLDARVIERLEHFPADLTLGARTSPSIGAKLGGFPALPGSAGVPTRSCKR